MLFIVFFTCLSVGAQVNIEVISPTTVDMSDGYFQIKYKINTTDIEAFEAPDLNDFVVRSSGPYSGAYVSTSTETVVINNKLVTDNSSKTFTFTLSPKAKGNYHVGKATFVVDGKSHHSKAIDIRVTDNGGTTAPATKLQPYGTKVGQRDLFVSLDADKKEVYVNEPVLLNYRYYARPNSGFHNIYITEKPNFNQVIAHDLSLQHLDKEYVKHNNVDYITGLCHQTLIVPQQSGETTLPSLTFDCEVVQKNPALDDMLDVFFNTGYVIQRVQRNAPTLTINVKPLPQPAPSHFSGAVGNFRMTSAVAQRVLRSNEIANFQLTISGSGNLKMIVPPSVTLPDGMEIYAPQTTDSTTVSQNGIQGSITFNYAFIPRNVGSFVLPAIELSYFNPQTHAYDTLKTAPIPVQITPGKPSSHAADSDEQDIRDAFKASQGESVVEWGSALFWWGFPLVVLLFIVLHGLWSIWERLPHRSQQHQRQTKAARYAAKRMQHAAKLRHHSDEKLYYAEVVRSLYAYLADRLSMETSMIGQNYIMEKFNALGIEEETTRALLHIISVCEYAQYAPQNDLEKKESVYQDAIQTIMAIEQALKK